MGPLVGTQLVLATLATLGSGLNPLVTLTRHLAPHTARGCDGDTVTISCGADNKSVEYGSGVGRCPGAGQGQVQVQGAGCRVQAAQVTGVVRARCQGRQTCALPVTGAVLQPGCGQHRGDLEVTYQCRPSRFRSRTMCRDDRDEISCPGRQLGLVILSASFVSVVDSHFFCPRGGRGPQLPSSGVSDVMGECVRTSVSSGVEQRCHGRHHCAVEASPSLLSAPECEHLNVFLKVIYACVEQKNIIPSVPSQLNILGTQETDKSSTPDKNFTASIKNLETTTNSGIYKDELKIQDVEKLRRDKNEETFEQTQEILGVGKMTDKKMIYGSELKLLSDPHRKISNEHGDTAAAGRRRAAETEADTFDINILENSPDDNLLSSLTEDPELLTVLITSVAAVVTLLGLALIFSLVCRKRAGGAGKTSGGPAPALVNLDTVSLESGEQSTLQFSQQKQQEMEPHPHHKNVSLSTFQNTEISMLLPSSSSSSASSTTSSAGSCAGSSQFLQDIKTLDEKYSLVSSTPSTAACGPGQPDKRMGRFKTFSESTLLESISETDSELHTKEWPELGPRDLAPSYGTDHEHSFEHYSHHGAGSACSCASSQCRNNQNLTFII